MNKNDYICLLINDKKSKPKTYDTCIKLPEDIYVSKIVVCPTQEEILDAKLYAYSHDLKVIVMSVKELIGVKEKETWRNLT